MCKSKYFFFHKSYKGLCAVLYIPSPHNYSSTCITSFKNMDEDGWNHIDIKCVKGDHQVDVIM